MRFALRFAICLTLAIAGCEGRDPSLPDLVPVTGTVTLDDKPLSNASLQFIPSGSTVGTGSGGATDAEGKYTLRTAHDGVGAPVGEYRVLISKYKRPDGSDFPLDSPEGPMDAGADESLPPQYSDPEKSTLTATVPAGGGTIDFPLKSKPY
jgi:hypothetical protein